MHSDIDITGALPYGNVRKDCHAVKGSSERAIARQGARLAGLVGDDTLIIPIPGHTGIPTYTLKLARAVSKQAARSGKRVLVFDVLRCRRHQPLYDAKKAGMDLECIPLEFRFTRSDILGSLRAFRRFGYGVYLLDNVVDTGRTVRAAMEVVGECRVLAVGDTGAHAGEKEAAA